MTPLQEFILQLVLAVSPLIVVSLRLNSRMKLLESKNKQLVATSAELEKEVSRLKQENTLLRAALQRQQEILDLRREGF